MKAAVVKAPPCKLTKGELRRVPLNRESWVIGYHVCCPKCGFVSLALNGIDGLTIDESAAGEVSFSKPLRCLYCHALIQISRCELTWEDSP